MKQLLLCALCAMILGPAFGQEEKKKAPCSGEEYRQFDFWLGDWEAYTPDGKLAGTNDIVVMQGGCIVQENWSSGGGAYTGTSYSFYDKAEEEWKQLWIDNQGGHLMLTGNMVDGEMILGNTGEADDGSAYKNKITWTPNEDGSVRQLWVASKDGGETWTTIFDGHYKKK